MRVAEKVATADILSGGRVEWGTGRSTPMEQTAFGVDREESRDAVAGGDRDRRRHVGEEYFEFHGKYLEFPRADGDAQAGPGPAPAVLDGGHVRRHRRRWPASSGSACCRFSILQPLEKMAEHDPPVPRGGSQPDADHAGRPPTRSPPTRWCTAPTRWQQAEDNGIWDSVWWWYKNLAEFTLEWELPHLSARRSRTTAVPAAASGRSRATFDPQVFDDADMIIVGDPDQCLEKMQQYAELGVDQLICYVQFGYLSHESVMRTIELLGKEVIPELEREHRGQRHGRRRRRRPARTGPA